MFLFMTRISDTSCEGYVSDQNHPSHASGLLYKGAPNNYVRDEGLLRAVFSLIART